MSPRYSIKSVNCLFTNGMTSTNLEHSMVEKMVVKLCKVCLACINYHFQGVSGNQELDYELSHLSIWLGLEWSPLMVTLKK